MSRNNDVIGCWHAKQPTSNRPGYERACLSQHTVKIGRVPRPFSKYQPTSCLGGQSPPFLTSGSRALRNAPRFRSARHAPHAFGSRAGAETRGLRRNRRCCRPTAGGGRGRIAPAIARRSHRSRRRPRQRGRPPSPVLQRCKGAAPQPLRLRLAISKVSLDRPAVSSFPLA